MKVTARREFEFSHVEAAVQHFSPFAIEIHKIRFIFLGNCVLIVKISSSSHAVSMDFPGSLSLSVPIFYSSRLVFQTISCVHRELMLINSSMKANTGTSRVASIEERHIWVCSSLMWWGHYWKSKDELINDNILSSFF